MHPAVFALALAALPLPTRAHVQGPGLATYTVVTTQGAEVVAFAALSRMVLAPQTVQLVGEFSGDRTGVEVPHCGGRKRVTVDGVDYTPPPGPFVVRLPARDTSHHVSVELDVSSYERRVACGDMIRSGPVVDGHTGAMVLDFASPETARGGGHAVLYVPASHDATKPGPLLVGVHPWNGTMWTYAAYTELLAAAEQYDVPLLLPSGLGNSLYTADAEREVLRAMDAAEAALLVDRQRVSIWGASMGGQGAMTIALHHPDTFAVVGSFFGDARFDLSTYIRSILPTPEAAHRVNPLDAIDNARHQATWLIHGDADQTSNVRESDQLNQALVARAYAVHYDRVPGRGHEGRLVAEHVATIVERAHVMTAPRRPARVTFRSVRAEDVEAYGVHLVRSAAGDAFVDVEAVNGTLVLRAATNVREVVLAEGALGLPGKPPLSLDAKSWGAVTVRWE